MRKLLYLIFPVMMAYSNAIAHGGHQAFYRLSIENGMLMLTSKLEMPDLRVCVEKSATCSADKDFNWCAGAWLENQLSVKIDGVQYSLQLESTVIEDGHLILSHTLGTAPPKIGQVKIVNYAFVETFEDYQNVFQIHLLGNRQGYKMNRHRTSIKHKL